MRKTASAEKENILLCLSGRLLSPRSCIDRQNQALQHIWATTRRRAGGRGVVSELLLKSSFTFEYSDSPSSVTARRWVTGLNGDGVSHLHRHNGSGVGVQKLPSDLEWWWLFKNIQPEVGPNPCEDKSYSKLAALEGAAEVKKVSLLSRERNDGALMRDGFDLTVVDLIRDELTSPGRRSQGKKMMIKLRCLAN